MNRRVALFLVALLFASAAEAEIHKCVAADGNVTYSQVPCPIEKSDTERAPVATQEHVLDCSWATAFASDVTRSMRAGLTSDAVFDLYGGANQVSPGTVNIINYVFRFRADTGVPAERITSLAHSMCEAGSLGDVRCELLPYGQDMGSNRCNPDAGSYHAAAEPPATGATTNAASEQCKQGARDEIDAIDAQMRQGYDLAQGELYRERLLALTKRLREC